jgi:hypothetical protein
VILGYSYDMHNVDTIKGKELMRLGMSEIAYDNYTFSSPLLATMSGYIYMLLKLPNPKRYYFLDLIAQFAHQNLE